MSCEGNRLSGHLLGRCRRPARRIRAVGSGRTTAASCAAAAGTRGGAPDIGRDTPSSARATSTSESGFAKKLRLTIGSPGAPTWLMYETTASTFGRWAVGPSMMSPPMAYAPSVRAIATYRSGFAGRVTMSPMVSARPGQSAMRNGPPNMSCYGRCTRAAGRLARGRAVTTKLVREVRLQPRMPVPPLALRSSPTNPTAKPTPASMATGTPGT